MTRHVLIDTGPVVAGLNRRDEHHAWARALLERTRPPLFTCEAVLAEACFLLRDTGGGSAGVMEMVNRGVLQPAFRLRDHVSSVAGLMEKYADVPMSLADACLVRMSELYDDCTLATCDGDFCIYRRNGRRRIPVAMPG